MVHHGFSASLRGRFSRDGSFRGVEIKRWTLAQKMETNAFRAVVAVRMEKEAHREAVLAHRMQDQITEIKTAAKRKKRRRGKRQKRAEELAKMKRSMTAAAVEVQRAARGMLMRHVGMLRTLRKERAATLMQRLVRRRILGWNLLATQREWRRMRQALLAPALEALRANAREEQLLRRLRVEAAVAYERCVFEEALVRGVIDFSRRHAAVQAEREIRATLAIQIHARAARARAILVALKEAKRLVEEQRHVDEAATFIQRYCMAWLKSYLERWVDRLPAEGRARYIALMNAVRRRKYDLGRPRSRSGQREASLEVDERATLRRYAAIEAVMCAEDAALAATVAAKATRLTAFHVLRQRNFFVEREERLGSLTGDRRPFMTTAQLVALMEREEAERREFRDLELAVVAKEALRARVRATTLSTLRERLAREDQDRRAREAEEARAGTHLAQRLADEALDAEWQRVRDLKRRASADAKRAFRCERDAVLERQRIERAFVNDTLIRVGQLACIERTEPPLPPLPDQASLVSPRPEPPARSSFSRIRDAMAWSTNQQDLFRTHHPAENDSGDSGGGGGRPQPTGPRVVHTTPLRAPTPHPEELRADPSLSTPPPRLRLVGASEEASSAGSSEVSE